VAQTRGTREAPGFAWCKVRPHEPGPRAPSGLGSTLVGGGNSAGQAAVFVGVEPATEWLKACGVELDAEGFVRTGAGDHDRRPPPLESNVPHVFAVGDARSGSTKRVGGAIGEGAAVVSQLHTVLAEASAIHA
jgi:pyruvate/2-oxoglutarate dehydrogenase complex dihydrolipoamide dehydrogenase (E3) component